MKLGFDIAVDQQTRTSDQTFEGVPDPNRQTVPAGQPRPYLVQIRPNLAKYPEHAQNPDFMCISQFATFAKLTSLKTIELNRVSIFFHEIFRINVELPHDLEFSISILS